MKTNRVIALMIGLLLTFSMTACGEQMSAMNTDMEKDGRKSPPWTWKTDGRKIFRNMEGHVQKFRHEHGRKMKAILDRKWSAGRENSFMAVKTTSSLPTTAGKSICPWIKRERRHAQQQLRRRADERREGAKEVSAEEYETPQGGRGEDSGDRGTDRGACR